MKQPRIILANLPRRKREAREAAERPMRLFLARERLQSFFSAFGWLPTPDDVPDPDEAARRGQRNAPTLSPQPPHRRSDASDGLRRLNPLSPGELA
jgi:hypothetical protein